MTRRRVVARGGELERGVGAERQKRLHAALAEAALAHDHGTPMILQRARDDLAGRGRTGIDQHDHRHVLGDLAAIDRFGVVDVSLARGTAALRDDAAFLEEEVAQRHRFVERAAGVGAQVEHQAVEAPGRLLGQRFPGGEDIGPDVARELVDHDHADVARLELVGDRLEFDQPARDRDVERLVAPGAEDRQADRGAGGSAHAGDCLVEIAPVDQFAVEMGDIVAGLEPGLHRRTAAERRDDLHRPVVHLHGQAEPGVIAVDHRFEPLQIRPVEIGGVRIEAGEHAVDRAADQRLVVDRLDVAGLDPLVGREQAREFGAGAAVDLRDARSRRRDERYRSDERGRSGEIGEFDGHKASFTRALLSRARA